MSLLVDVSLIRLGKNVKIKIMGVLMSYYVIPLYKVKQDITFDKKTKLSCWSFWEKCGISNERITPKKLKIGKEIKKDEVVALFGSCNYNG
jgi:hypothetical protein